MTNEAYGVGRDDFPFLPINSAKHPSPSVKPDIYDPNALRSMLSGNGGIVCMVESKSIPPRPALVVQAEIRGRNGNISLEECLHEDIIAESWRISNGCFIFPIPPSIHAS